LKTVSQKELISRDIKTLNKLHEDFTSKIDDLKKKYENLCKSKSLMSYMAKRYEKQCQDKLKEVDHIMIEIKNVRVF